MALYVISTAVTTNKPTHYALTMDGGASFDVTAQTQADASVRLHYDVTAIGAGTHNMTAKAVIIDAVQGRLESTSVPFSFVKIAIPTAPSGLALSLT